MESLKLSCQKVMAIKKFNETEFDDNFKRNRRSDKSTWHIVDRSCIQTSKVTVSGKQLTAKNSLLFLQNHHLRYLIVDRVLDTHLK